jgi:succinyl-CoA synthetase alpha subunit
MSILINKKTKVIVQGITGRDGSFHAEQMKKYGTNVVGGVTPGKGGTEVNGIPVFNSVADAVAGHICAAVICH